MEERVEFTMSDVIPEELLAGLSDTDREMESINRPSISYWRTAGYGLRRISWPCWALPLWCL